MNVKKILVADDDKVVRTVLAKIAQKHSIEVQAVEDGGEAEELLSRDQSYDLLILDLLMPNVSGWEVLESIRNKPETKELPVVVLTGASISSDEKKRLAEMTSGLIDKETFSLRSFEELLKQEL